MECEEFQQLVRELDPKYEMPSRTLIDKEMTKLYTELKGIVLAKLQYAHKVSVCVDLWSKKFMSEAFLGITAHFFTRTDHKRIVAILAVRSFPSPHTADRNERTVSEVLLEWDIPQEKVCAILTDNGSNIVAAFRHWLLETQDVEEQALGIEEDDNSPTYISDNGSNSGNSGAVASDNEMEQSQECSTEEEIEKYDQHEISHEVAFSSHKRLSCFSHTLQLAICKFDTIMGPKHTLQSAHRLVRKFNKSVKATEILISLCGKKLLYACPTRWNSTYIMISRLLKIHTHVESVLQQLE